MILAQTRVRGVRDNKPLKNVPEFLAENGEHGEVWIYLFFQAEGRSKSPRLVIQPLLLLLSNDLRFHACAVLLVCVLSMSRRFDLCASPTGSFDGKTGGFDGNTVGCAMSSSFFGARMLSREDAAMPSENRGVDDDGSCLRWARSLAKGSPVPCLISAVHIFSCSNSCAFCHKSYTKCCCFPMMHPGCTIRIHAML